MRRFQTQALLVFLCVIVGGATQAKELSYTKADLYQRCMVGSLENEAYCKCHSELMSKEYERIARMKAEQKTK